MSGSLRHLARVRQIQREMPPGSLDDEHFARRELIRKQFGTLIANDDHVLDMPMAAVRLDCQHHALLKHNVAVARHDRFLLVPPAANTVADQHRLVFPALFVEFLDDEFKHVSRADARLTSFDGFIVDVPEDEIIALLLVARFAENDVAGLMAGITLGTISDVIVANDVTALKHRVPLATVIDRVRAGGQDSVHPAGAAIEAIVDDAAVELALAITGPGGPEGVEISLVKQVGRFFQKRDLPRRLDPADLVHHFGAIDQLQLRQQRKHLLPMGGADEILLNSDALARQTGVLYDRAQPAVRRLAVSLI